MPWAIANKAQSEDDRAWGLEYWHNRYGFSAYDMTRFTDEEKATVSLPIDGEWVELPTTHEFGDTGDAYDACQCSPKIGTGDTLVIESDGVVGLAYAWPVAVTREPGKLHVLSAGSEIIDTIDGITVDQVRAAVAVATDRGYPIAPEFEQYR